LESIFDNILWTEWVCLAAAILYTICYKKLSNLERWIVVLLWSNVLADRIASINLNSDYNLSGIIYNQLAPFQRAVTLLIYYAYLKSVKIKKLNLIGLVAVLCIHAAGWAIYGDVSVFHRDIFIYSGLIVAVLSYLTLQEIILNQNEISTVIIAFCMGSFAYLTLMASAHSAVELIYEQDKSMGELVYLGNDIGYAIWSLSLITAILWRIR